MERHRKRSAQDIKLHREKLGAEVTNLSSKTTSIEKKAAGTVAARVSEDSIHEGEAPSTAGIKREVSVSIADLRDSVKRMAMEVNTSIIIPSSVDHQPNAYYTSQSIHPSITSSILEHLSFLLSHFSIIHSYSFL